jgi:hypothetical protein
MRCLVSLLLAAAATLPAVLAQTPPPADAAAPVPAVSPDAVQYLPPAAAPKLAAPPSNYSPPAGFGGHAWGDLRKDFQQLPAEAASVTAAWSPGEHASAELHCTGSGRAVVSMPGLGGATGSAIGGGAANGVAGCSMADVANSMRPTLATPDFRVLSEYSIAGQGFRMSGVLLFPVVYEFCAQWEKGRAEVPANFEAINRYCGMRLLFQMEWPAELAGLPQDHVSRFDLVLNELVSRYGNPDDAIRNGQKSKIEPIAAGALRRDRNFRTWRWCPMPATQKPPSCQVSIVLAADPQAARGIVIFATPALWRHAEARETSLGMPDALYTLLHGLPIQEREQQRQARLAQMSAESAREAALKAVSEEPVSKPVKAARTVYDVAINEE